MPVAWCPLQLLPLPAGEAAQEQKDEEEFEMQLGPLKTAVFAVRASSWTCRMAAYQKPFPFRSITLATSSSCWHRARWASSARPCRAPSWRWLCLQVLTSWSKADNLMLGGAGLAWEIIWLWLVARGPVPTTSRRDFLSPSEFQVVLATDVVGYLFRAGQAACLGRTTAGVSLPSCRRPG